MDLRDRNNWTPLHTAIKNSGTQQGCHDAAMELLISTGIISRHSQVVLEINSVARGLI